MGLTPAETNPAMEPGHPKPFTEREYPDRDVEVRNAEFLSDGHHYELSVAMSGVVGQAHDLHRKMTAGSAFRQMDVAGGLNGLLNPKKGDGKFVDDFLHPKVVSQFRVSLGANRSTFGEKQAASGRSQTSVSLRCFTLELAGVQHPITCIRFITPVMLSVPPSDLPPKHTQPTITYSHRRIRSGLNREPP